MKFRVKRRVRLCGFNSDLDAMYEKMFGGQFFDDLDDIRVNTIKEQKRLERYKARRAANETKAYRILLRLRRVEAIDLFEMTQDIIPNFFGEKDMQFDEVKRLYLKKARIIWFLTGLYKYWAFDYEGQGWSAKRGFGYKRHRDYYYTLLEVHYEKMRQQRWDLKRAKVRTRRNKGEDKGMSKERAMLYALRREMGNNVPMPVRGIDETIWDD